ncbi:M48 family metallopeptidase [soil metagenome]
MRLALFAVAGVITAAGCDVPQEQEVSLGADAASEINAQLPLIEDPYIKHYVQRLGQDIADQTERRDLTWHFHVVDSPQINAFALPGGYVYVNRGLIEATRSVTELAGVLGHEIGHIVQRHSIDQMQKHAGAGLGISVLCSVTNVCESEIGQAALQIGGSFVLARYSRRDEFEADSEAVVNVMRAGIHPIGVPRVFERFMEAREVAPSQLENWFASHPLEEARIDAAREMIAQLDPRQLERLQTDDGEYAAFRERVAALPPSPEGPPPEPLGQPLP